MSAAYYTTTKSFTRVMLRQTDADQAHFKSTKEQFFQALYDNLVESFPKTEIFTAARVLDVNYVVAGWFAPNFVLRPINC